MPRATMREESAYPLPEEYLLTGKLNAVTIKNHSGVSNKPGKPPKPYDFNTWLWEFEVTEGEFTGIRAWVETEDSLNNLDAPRGRAALVRPFAETLLGRTIEIGEDFDTDQVVGLPCKFTVSHEEPRQKKDGGWFYGCPVQDVFPAAASAASVPF